MAISTSGLTYNHLTPYIRSEACLYGSHSAVARKGWVCGKHLHHMMTEFNLVFKGKTTVTVGSAEFVQQEGDLLIVSPMQMHDFRVDESDEMHYFTMHVQLPDPYFIELLERENINLYPGGHPVNEALTPYIRQIASALSGEVNSRIGLFANLYAICYELEKQLSTNRRPDGGWQPSTPYRIAKEIERLVVADGQEQQAANTTNDNWLEQISQQMGVSRRHAHRVFRQAYGMSPRQYLMVLKRQEAMQMLAGSRDTIETVAHRVGYENVQSFSRQFTEWTGYTPSEFRKLESSGVHHLTPLEL
ncbi:AraC family transcriptional regulator [Paenibacillus protaetiae]|uniref:AraC family transcriptional regulator n=1 Tax=Paenibacillus protaetiae TaxID=2509456 RepID=A0A4P6ESI8_9BACL|nr:AraC family transcriptional regulator [Paenibacillus protaetiae]QAY65385.1 AraC family transcriptional regulator [Paenibacillus protaetiae]